MTYFNPDRITVAIIAWSVRITILCIAIAVVSAAASFAIRAVMLLGGSLLSLIHPLVTMIGSADPLVQLSLQLFAFLVLLGISVKLFLAILASQGIGRSVA